jgi:hypothetical protein
MKSAPMSRLFLMSRSRFSRSMRSETSSMLVGSSATISAGFTERARAIATRWRCPARELVRIAAREVGGGREPDGLEAAR